MATLGDIELALAVVAHAAIATTAPKNMNEVWKCWSSVDAQRKMREQVTLLHCTSQYPCPDDEVNLKAIATLAHSFQLPVGYSDHSDGLLVPLAAVALGATVLEKHFTLDRSLPGPDQLASLEPNELRNMVQSIRNIEKAIGGSGIKEPSESEKKNISIARKSIVAKTLIQKGERFTEFNITSKRPGTGISPMRWDEVIDSIACRDFDVDELIKLV